MYSANFRQSRPGEAGSRRIGLSSTAQDRLKPPVSAINMEHKVIKLSGSKNTASLSSSEDRQSVQNIRHLKQSTVTESNTVHTSCQNSTRLAAESSQKIKLSQPDTASAAEKQQEHQTVINKSTNSLPAKRTSLTTEETEKKKFKATAITWP